LIALTSPTSRPRVATSSSACWIVGLVIVGVIVLGELAGRI
jgi:hypothetical protein